MNIAIIIASLANIVELVNLDNVSLISPKAGNIKIYTSGCPKNQNRC
jgi:hypothetical protein